MRIKYLFLIILVIPFISFGQNAMDIAKSCLPSTVSLIMEDNLKQPISLGSGFVIDKGKIVTNLHVIEGAEYGYVLENGSPNKHKIEGYFSVDKKNDLAILSVPSLDANSLILTDQKRPEIGEKIYAIGNPKGLSGTISEGIVSGIRDLENKNLIQITAPISPGSSGGPVINNSGQVLGVAVGTLTSGQNLNFAIPISELKKLLESKNNAITSLNIAKGTTAPKTEKNEVDIKEGIIVRNIECNNFFGTQISFSLKNDLPYSVSDIRILFLLYDTTGTVIDYIEKEYLSINRFSGNKEGIKPFLAKSFGYSSSKTGTELKAEFKPGYKLKARVLDFRILDE